MGIARVTAPNARHWGVSADAWRKEMVNAALLDPKKMVSNSRKVEKALERGHTARIRHPNGTDLTLALAGRKPRVDLGWVTAASPSRAVRLDGLGSGWVCLRRDR